MPPHLESRLRAIKFAQYLIEAGYEVILFGSSVMHNMNMNLIEDGARYVRRNYGNIDFVHINTWMYGKTSKVRRVISDYLFFNRLARYAKDFKKPDYIIATGGPMILPNPIMHFARTNRIPYIKESLDVWPDDFVDFGLLSAKNPIMKVLFTRAKSNISKADAMVYSWSGCYEYIKNKKWDKENGGPIDLNKVYYINNGVDLTDFEKYKSKYQINDPDLESNYKRITYLGSIRLVNNVMQLIYAAEIMKDREDVKFLIYGDGIDRDRIIDYCKKKNLTNVIVKDKWIDPKYVPYVLSKSYINILNYISSDFAKNGISSSKLFQYMAAGKPIVCNINILHCPITKNNIGIAKELKTPQEYADAITELLNISSQDYIDMGNRARIVAKQFDYKYLTSQMIQILNKL